MRGIQKPVSNQAGFSLIELLVVMTIMLILGTVAMPNLLDSKSDAFQVAMLNDLEGFARKGEQHYRRFNEYPDSIQGSGTETAKTMNFVSSPEVTLTLGDGTMTGYQVRAVHAKRADTKCELVMTTDGAKPQCGPFNTTWGTFTAPSGS